MLRIMDRRKPRGLERTWKAAGTGEIVWAKGVALGGGNVEGVDVDACGNGGYPRSAMDKSAPSEPTMGEMPWCRQQDGE